MPAFPWGALIGAGGDLLSGFLGGQFGKKEDNYHPEVWRNDMYKNKLQEVRAIKDAARIHGFHPLALMGMSGGGGFAQPVSDSFRGGGWGDVAGSLGSRVGQAYDDYQSAKADEAALDDAKFQRILDDQANAKIAALNEELLRAQIEETRSRTAANNLQMLERSAAPVSRTLVGPGGSIFTPEPGRSTAQEMEDQYGEMGDLVGGTAGMAEDLIEGRVVVPPNWLGELERRYNQRIWDWSGGRFGYNSR